MEAKALAEKVVRIMATRMYRQSAFMWPDPQMEMTDPYAVLDCFRDEGVATPDEIDAWLVDAQRIEKAKP